MAKVKPIEFTDSWGDKLQLILYRGEYYTNGNLAVVALCDDGEQYGVVTTNIEKLPSEHACLDTNNMFELSTALLTAGDAVLTDRSIRSGYHTYPVVRFTDEFMDSLPTFDEVAAYFDEKGV